MSSTIEDAYDELMQSHIRLQRTFYNITGDRDVARSLGWAIERIEELQLELLEAKKRLAEAGCVYCNAAKRAQVLGDQTKSVNLATVVPLNPCDSK